ncbi:MAG: KH domain-containing protein [Solirubrobacterales bacterium]
MSAREQEPDNADAPTMAELLAYMARGLVDRPEEVSVEQFEEGDGTIVLELCVGEDEYGKVIGRGGRTAHALRTVIRAAATHERRRVQVEIVD